jgi:hypothetical protein
MKESLSGLSAVAMAEGIHKVPESAVWLLTGVVVSDYR